MTANNPTRRTALAVGAGLASAPKSGALFAADEPLITVHRDPNCGCCTGWVRHLQNAGFRARVIETRDVDAVKSRLGVPEDLAACHTAEVVGYVIEGHVPVTAIRRLLGEKPSGRGLAVPGMPVGSPGMEGANPEPYAVTLFGPNGRSTYMRFLGDKALG
jgi:hypothetical protein